MVLGLLVVKAIVSDAPEPTFESGQTVELPISSQAVKKHGKSVESAFQATETFSHSEAAKFARRSASADGSTEIALARPADSGQHRLSSYLQPPRFEKNAGQGDTSMEQPQLTAEQQRWEPYSADSTTTKEEWQRSPQAVQLERTRLSRRPRLVKTGSGYQSAEGSGQQAEGDYSRSLSGRVEIQPDRRLVRPEPVMDAAEQQRQRVHEQYMQLLSMPQANEAEGRQVKAGDAVQVTPEQAERMHQEALSQILERYKDKKQAEQIRRIIKQYRQNQKNAKAENKADSE